MKGKILSHENLFEIGQTKISLQDYPFINAISSDTEVIFGIRPEDININKDNVSSLKCKVELIEPMGADTLIWTSIEKTPISIRIEGNKSFELGDEIEITLNIPRASIFDKISEKRI